MCVWPTALNLGCVTNLDTLFLAIISLIDEIHCLLTSGCHICIRSMVSVETEVRELSKRTTDRASAAAATEPFNYLWYRVGFPRVLVLKPDRIF